MGLWVRGHDHEPGTRGLVVAPAAGVVYGRRGAANGHPVTKRAKVSMPSGWVLAQARGAPGGAVINLVVGAVVFGAAVVMAFVERSWL